MTSLDAPWVLQVYVQDEPSLKRFAQDLSEYPDPRLRHTSFTRHQQAVMEDHLTRISKPGGLFIDQAVTGSPWRGKRRVVRATLYRRLHPGGKPPPLIEVEEALNDVAARWTASMASAGIRAHRGNGQDLYEWLLPWFNPAAEEGQARRYVNENVDRIRRMFKWAAGNEMIPFDVYQRICNSPVDILARSHC